MHTGQPRLPHGKGSVRPVRAAAARAAHCADEPHSDGARSRFEQRVHCGGHSGRKRAVGRPAHAGGHAHLRHKAGGASRQRRPGAAGRLCGIGLRRRQGVFAEKDDRARHCVHGVCAGF